MHALKRLQERYNKNFNEFDLIMIEILIIFGFAKKLQLPANKIQKQQDTQLYHIRYSKKLIKAITIRNSICITFLPTGKGVSQKKHYVSKLPDDFVYKIKRIGKKISF